MKRKFPLVLSALLLLSSVSFAACDTPENQTKQNNVLRVASWDEYIDMGGEDSYYSADSRPLYEEFEDWYKQTYGKEITVEFCEFIRSEIQFENPQELAKQVEEDKEKAKKYHGIK